MDRFNYKTINVGIVTFLYLSALLTILLFFIVFWIPDFEKQVGNENVIRFLLVWFTLTYISYRRLECERWCRSFKNRIASFRYTFSGLKALLQFENNSRIHLVAAAFAITFGFVMKISIIEWSLLIGIIALVFMAEIFNSAIENLADHISPRMPACY